MAIYLGSGAISDVKLGSSSITAAYIGTTQVWPGGAPPTTYYQYQIPGGPFINQSNDNQAQVPGGPFVNGA